MMNLHAENQEDASQWAHFAIFCSHNSSNERVVLVGAPTWAGSWDPTKGLEMIPHSDDLWILDVKIPKKAQFEYKYVVFDVHTKQVVKREGGKNRCFIAPSRPEFGILASAWNE
jgi:hypothetical protein